MCKIIFHMGFILTTYYIFCSVRVSIQSRVLICIRGVRRIGGAPSSGVHSQTRPERLPDSVSQYQLQAKRNTKFAQIFIALFPGASCLLSPLSYFLSTIDLTCANCLVFGWRIPPVSFLLSSTVCVCV